MKSHFFFYCFTFCWKRALLGYVWMDGFGGEGVLFFFKLRTYKMFLKMSYVCLKYHMIIIYHVLSNFKFLKYKIYIKCRLSPLKPSLSEPLKPNPRHTLRFRLFSRCYIRVKLVNFFDQTD
jgi:hypothetical protein